MAAVLHLAGLPHGLGRAVHRRVRVLPVVRHPRNVKIEQRRVHLRNLRLEHLRQLKVPREVLLVDDRLGLAVAVAAGVPLAAAANPGLLTTRPQF